MGKKDRINLIDFRIAIPNEKYKRYCGKCRQQVDTKEGFIYIDISKTGEYGNTKVNLCLNCFNEFSKQKEALERNKKSIYNEMVKKRVIRELKK